MWPDRVLNSGTLALESDALPPALCGPADWCHITNMTHTVHNIMNDIHVMI